MNRAYLWSVVVFFILFVSCDNMFVDCENYDYYDCDQNEPTQGELSVELTINSENPAVPVVIYLGNFEERDTVLDTILTTSELKYNLDVDHRYSATATYHSGDKTIVAVDGDDMEKKSSKVCSATCWKVKGNILDIRLKN